MPDLIISTRIQLPSIIEVHNPRLGKRDRWVDHPAWEKFSTEPTTYIINTPDPVRKYLMTRAQRLKEKYNAEVKFDHDRGLGILTFDTDEDMMLFLMEWS